MADYTVRFLGDDSQLSGTLKNIKGELNSTGQASSKLDQIQQRFNRIINSSAPLKKQLRDLTALMAKMNLDNMIDNDLFVTMTAKAAEMKDALGDASQAIRLMSSDTAKLDATIEGFQVLAGAAGVVTGVMGTLGTENERLQQAMLKVQSVISVMNGVQQIANALNKDSILMLRLKALQQKINNALTATSTSETEKNTASTTVNTAASVVNTTSTKKDTIAQKAWNVVKAISKALLGDFTGLLIVGAGALLTYALATSDSTKETDKQAKATKRAKEATDDYIIKARAAKQLNDDIAKAHSEVTSSVAKEKNQINALTSIIHSNTATLDQKKSAINELRSIIPSYTATIDSEGTVHDNATTSIENHIKALDDLQRAMTAYKTGEKIQQALADASFEKYKADKKVKTKQNNVNKVKKVLGKNEKSTDDYDPIYGTPIYKKSSTVKKREELKIQQSSLDNAKREQKAADLKYKTAQKEADDYKKWAKSYSSPKAQSAVAESNGDFNKAADIVFNRNNPNPTTKHTTGGGRTGRTNKTTPVNTVETPSEKLQKAINEAGNKVKFLQLQLDHNIINQEQYNSEYLEVQKTLLSAYEQNAQATGKISEGYKKQLDLVNTTTNKLEQQEKEKKYTNLDENISAEYTKLAQDRNKGLISETEYQNKLLDLYKTYASSLKEYVDTIPEAKEALENITKEINKIEVSSKINEITKPSTKSVSLAERYKTYTPKEQRQNKIDTNVSRYDELSDQISQLKELQNQVGKNTEAWQKYAEAIKGIESEQSKIVNETDSLVNDSKYEDLIDQVKKYKKELISVSYSSLKSGLSDINNIYSSFANLSDNLDRANNGFEKFMVIMNSAFSVIDSVVGIINGVSSVISIIQGIAGANNALSVSSAATAGALGAQTASIVAQEAAGATKMASDIAQIATTKALTAALLEQAAAGFFAAHAYIPFAGFGIGAGFASSAAALVKSLGAATLLADGGVVGGNSYHGDTIIAGLNAGEMVLNRKQQANLFRALDNGIASNVGGGKVEFEIKGSTLKGVLKNYDNKMNKVR